MYFTIKNIKIERIDDLNWMITRKIRNVRSTAKNTFRWENLGYYATLEGACSRVLSLIPDDGEEIEIKKLRKRIKRWGNEIVETLKGIKEEIKKEMKDETNKVTNK
jgi:hypothetical protein